jgi:hypothetical protein
MSAFIYFLAWLRQLEEQRPVPAPPSDAGAGEREVRRG